MRSLAGQVLVNMRSLSGQILVNKISLWSGSSKHEISVWSGSSKYKIHLVGFFKEEMQDLGSTVFNNRSSYVHVKV
jgi:hypothetical protein